MVSPPTATSFALLGLLGVQPWTAYELVGQMRRNMHFIWPRSEAHLYAELKRLVERGHATAEVIEGRRRQRTRYMITSEGTAALQDWLTHPPAAPLLEVEGLLRMFVGDQGSADDLLAALRSTAEQTRELHVQGGAVIKNVLEGGSPFPERLHLVAPIAIFYDRFYRLLIEWCDETAAAVDRWPGVRDVGLTPDGRETLMRLLAAPEP